MATTEVAISGEVDIARVGEIRALLAGAIEADPGGTVRVDLSGLEFIDSTGLGALVGGMKRARAADGRLILTGAPPTIRKLLQITGLDKAFEVED
jgi:anti-sigma B factor antagonist